MQPRPSELEVERAALLRADRDIAKGEQRLRAQIVLAAQLRTSGLDHDQADRLCQTLQATLTEWRAHRELIIAHIAHLEAKQAQANAGGFAPLPGRHPYARLP